MTVIGNEIELDVICQVENFEVIGQGQSKILLNSFHHIVHYVSEALCDGHHLDVVKFRSGR